MRARPRVSMWLLLGVLLLHGACQDDPVDPFALSPCSNLPPGELSNVPALTMTQMIPVLEDAVLRLVRVFPEGRSRKELRTALNDLAEDPELKDTSCRLLLVCWRALERLDQEDASATRPDRAAIRLGLGLTSHCLRSS